MLRTLLRWVCVLLQICRKPDFTVRFVKSHGDVGDDPTELIVVGDPDYPKWACFPCPGGCGEAIKLNMSPSRAPCWIVKTDCIARPTVHPSVWQRNDCGCHFWVRNGHVDWCEGGRPASKDDSG